MRLTTPSDSAAQLQIITDRGLLMRAYGLWSINGWDTKQIADHLKLEESAVYNSLSNMREERRIKRAGKRGLAHDAVERKRLAQAEIDQLLQGHAQPVEPTLEHQPQGLSLVRRLDP